MRISDWSSDVCSSDLLNAFAGNIASDRGAVALARDLIDLVDIDDALLRFFDVAVCGLQKFGDDAFDIFADIAGLGRSEERRVGKECVSTCSIRGSRYN